MHTFLETCDCYRGRIKIGPCGNIGNYDSLVVYYKGELLLTEPEKYPVMTHLFATFITELQANIEHYMPDSATLYSFNVLNQKNWKEDADGDKTIEDDKNQLLKLELKHTCTKG